MTENRSILLDATSEVLHGSAPPSSQRIEAARTIDLTSVAEEVEGGTGRDLKAASFYARLSRVLAVIDAGCAFLAAAAILLLQQPGAPTLKVLAALLAVGGSWSVIFRSYGLHSPHLMSGPEEFRKVLSASSVGALMAGFLLVWAAGLSFQEIAGMWLLATMLELTARRVARWRVAMLRKEGRLLFRTVIVGTNEEALQLAKLLEEEELGYKLVGFVRTDDACAFSDPVEPLGTTQALRDVLWEHDLECIFVASSSVAPKDMLKITQAARQGGADVRIAANIPDLFFSRLSVQSMGDLTSMALRPVRLSGGQAAAKRVVDVVLASTALFLTLPLTFAIGVIIKLGSPGPVLFKQSRITRGGHVFTMLKFRTMVEGSANTLDLDNLDPSEAFFKIHNDPRLTAAGRLLRRFSLDELPQLINVLRGEMSIVGPRPLPAEQVAANLELLAPRHEVRAGMTGWWQTNGRSEVDADEALRLDLFYIENWSLALDLYILLKTFGAVSSGRGAY